MKVVSPITNLSGSGTVECCNCAHKHEQIQFIHANCLHRFWQQAEQMEKKKEKTVLTLKYFSVNEFFSSD